MARGGVVFRRNQRRSEGYVRTRFFIIHSRSHLQPHSSVAADDRVDGPVGIRVESPIRGFAVVGGQRPGTRQEEALGIKRSSRLPGSLSGARADAAHLGPGREPRVRRPRSRERGRLGNGAERHGHRTIRGRVWSIHEAGCGRYPKRCSVESPASSRSPDGVGAPGRRTGSGNR